MNVVTELSETAWRAFIEAQSNSNIYHTPEMFQVFAQTHNHRPQIWAALDGDQPLALLLPVQVTLISRMLQPLTARAVCYGGVVAAPGAPGQAALDALLLEYRRNVGGAVLFTELRHIADTTAWQPTLLANRFAYEKHLNFLLDLQLPEATLWRNITKSGQQSIRTSRNKDTQIEAVAEPSGLLEIYSLLQKVYRRAQVPLAHPSLFEAVFKILSPTGMLQAFAAKVKGQMIGAVLLLAYKGRVVYWYGGLDRDFAAYAPMEHLLWHAIQWGQAKGYRVFDFGGAGRPDEDYGPRRFKAKFGGDLVELGRNRHVPSQMRLNLSEAGYQLVRRFF